MTGRRGSTIAHGDTAPGKDARGGTPRLLAAALLLSCALALTLGARAAQGAEAGGHVTVAFGCSGVTYTYSGFPNANGNTVKEAVFVSAKRIEGATFSFDGPAGSNTLPVVVPPGHHEMDARASWNTNGVRGDVDTPLRGGITCAPAPALSLSKQQRIGEHAKFTEAELKGEVGDVVEYEVLATNTGNVPLTLSALGDERCDPGTIGGGPGETPVPPRGSTSYHCSHAVGVADLGLDSLVNVASLTGTPPPGEGSEVTQSSNAVQVGLVPPVRARGQGAATAEGQSFPGTVATFTDTDTAAASSDYSATIEWGDGSSSAGVVSGGAGSFSVTGPHTYAEEGSYTVTVKVSDADNAQNSDEVHATVKVDDAPLSASGVAASSPLAFSGTVANLSDENSGAPAGDFSATVDWGDGAHSSATASGGGGNYNIIASHTYGAAGEYRVKVHITDAGGELASATSVISAVGRRSALPGGTQGSAPGVGVLSFVAGALPAPVFGVSANLIPLSGVVLIRLPGSSRFIPIHSATSVPLGTVIDATHGQVQLISAADVNSRTVESGIFYGGVFRVGQITVRAHGRAVALTVLTLVGAAPKGCAGHRGKRASVRAVGARTRGTSRKLWGNAKGNFRTVGRYAAATVRGTKWLTEDTCAGTLVRVARGVVRVADFPHRHVLALRAPRSFLAHPGRGG